MTFIVPIVLIIVWGAVFSNLNSGPDKMRLAFLNESNSPVGKQIESTLDTMKSFELVRNYKDDLGNTVVFDTNSIKEYVRKGNITAALVLPSDLFTDTSQGMNLKYYYDPKNEMEIQLYNGMIRQAVYQQLPAVLRQIMKQRADTFLGSDSAKKFTRNIDEIVEKYFKVKNATSYIDSFTTQAADTGKNGGASDFFKSVIRFDSEQLVGKEIANPWATRSVGGWAMMFLLFMVTASASSLFEEKRSGVVIRLLASPVSRVHILWSKYFYNMSLGCIQLVVLFGTGALLYKIDVFSNLFNLILIVIASAIACSAFGMLLASISRTAAQANGLATLLILTMSSIGGAWFPTSFMPLYIQSLSKLTIVYWSMDGFLQVLWRGVGFIDILPNLAVLIGMAAAITAISMWQFKKGHVF